MSSTIGSAVSAFRSPAACGMPHRSLAARLIYFTPRELNPRIWFDDTGDDINIWPDISGNQCHGVLNGGTNLAILKNSMNGRQVRYFGGVSNPNNGTRYIVSHNFTDPMPYLLFVVVSRRRIQGNNYNWQRLISFTKTGQTDYTTGLNISLASNSSGLPGVMPTSYITTQKSNVVGNQLGIGHHVTNPGYEYLTGDIAEVLVFDRPLPTASAMALKTYMTQKYNII